MRNLILIVLLMSCAALADVTQSSIVGDYQLYYPNGKLLEQGHRDPQGEQDGALKYYREDGSLKGEYHYQKGKLQGIQKEYFANGQLAQLETREQGKKLGLKQRYFDNGQLRSQLIYSVGGLDGLTQEFYINGTLQRESEYRQGQRHGMNRYYSKQGKLLVDAHYQQGRLQGEKKSYFADGTIRVMTEYLRGKKIGKEQAFYSNGQLKKESQFDGKSRLLSEVNYRDDGSERSTLNNEYTVEGRKRSTELKFREQKMVMRIQTDSLKKWKLVEGFNKSGKLESRAETFNRHKTGLQIERDSYWNSGDETRHQYYVNGKKQGDYKRFNAEGRVIELGQYLQGIKTGMWWRDDTDSELIEHYDSQGHLTGERNVVAANGQLLARDTFFAGKRHGSVEHYNLKGVLQQKGEYVNDKREGYWQFQDRYQRDVKIWQGAYRAGQQVGDWQAVSERGYLLGLEHFDEQGRKQGYFYEFAEDGSVTNVSFYIDDEWQI